MVFDMLGVLEFSYFMLKNFYCLVIDLFWIFDKVKLKIVDKIGLLVKRVCYFMFKNK